MRLIDADALIKELNNSHYPGAPYIDAGISIAIGKVCDAPTIEPERKTGKWIRHPEWEADGECGYECDQCGMGSDVDYNFCMRCGAKMERQDV